MRDEKQMGEKEELRETDEEANGRVKEEEGTIRVKNE